MSIFGSVALINIDVVEVMQNISQFETLPLIGDVGEDTLAPGERFQDVSEHVDSEENLFTSGNGTLPFEQAKTQISLSGLITTTWFIGFSISMIVILSSLIKFRRLTKSKIIALSSEQSQAIRGLVDGKVKVFITTAIQSPMVMGLFKPRLILTNSLFEMNGESTYVALKDGASEVISHELIHIKRKDILLKYLYLLARSIHWFNPLVYFIGPVINEDIELSCDEHLAKAMNLKEKKDYCRVILDLASQVPTGVSEYSTNFNGGLLFMKKRFNNIMKSGKKKRAVGLSIFTTLLIVASAVLVSCSSGKDGANPDEFVGVPSYHLFQYRSEPADLFYESDERIGLNILDGFFIYNFKKDKMEASFALSPGAFEKNFYLSPAMSENEKTIIIEGFNASSGSQVDYYYEYNISNKTIKRIDKSSKEVKRMEHPSFERQEKVLKAESWDVLDLRYYPEGKDVASYPFKKESLPYKTYIMQMEDDKIPFGRLTLTDDGRFEYSYSVIMSYLNFGNYKVQGSKYTLNTSDGERTFVFTKEGENFVFNEAESYESIMDNKEKMKDGTVFSLEK